MVGFRITDDGEGFTDDNINSFCTLWSKHKMELGCKGSGRFTWLNVFNSINITSYVYKSQTIVNIPFNLEFDRQKIEIEPSKVEKSKTIIEFKYVTEKYYREPDFNCNKKGYDKRIVSDSGEIKNAIIDYLYVAFAQLKERGFHFKIVINTSCGSSVISEQDICEPNKCDFRIEKDFNGAEQQFSLKYIFLKDGKGNKNIVLCANERSAHVIKPYSVGINDKLPDNDSIYVYITSNYLDGLDTDDRRGLDSYASSNKGPDIVYSISYDNLLIKISESLKKIIIKEYPSTEQSNKTIIEKVKASKPYLSKYIDMVDGAIMSEQSVESSAIKGFEKDKIEVSKKFSKALQDRNIDQESFQNAVAELSSVSAAELGEYILYRSQVLRALSSERIAHKKEEYIHDIFMPRKTSSTNPEEYLNTNLWILDDKFMSYLYAASDKSYKSINSEFNLSSERKKDDLKRPDAIVVYDRKDGKKNAIIIEFKSPSASIQEKLYAMSEVSRNIRIFREQNKDVISVWAFVITKIDEEFCEAIKTEGIYTELYTTKNSPPAFYRYNREIDSHIHIYDIESVAEEAKVRNSVFSKITISEV